MITHFDADPCYFISTDRDRLDLEFVHRFLSVEAYWSKNIPFETVKRSISNSLNFGIYYNDQQVGFARVITDYATIAYLGDVFIISEHRGKGLSKFLMHQIMAHPDLQGLRRWILLTVGAHELYRKFGWQNIGKPALYMEIFTPDCYASGTTLSP